LDENGQYIIRLKNRKIVALIIIGAVVSLTAALLILATDLRRDRFVISGSYL
jgi:hypothetical protein